MLIKLKVMPYWPTLLNQKRNLNGVNVSEFSDSKKKFTSVQMYRTVLKYICKTGLIDKNISNSVQIDSIAQTLLNILSYARVPRRVACQMSGKPPNFSLKELGEPLKFL